MEVDNEVVEVWENRIDVFLDGLDLLNIPLEENSSPSSYYEIINGAAENPTFRHLVSTLQHKYEEVIGKPNASRIPSHDVAVFKSKLLSFLGETGAAPFYHWDDSSFSSFEDCMSLLEHLLSEIQIVTLEKQNSKMEVEKPQSVSNSKVDSDIKRACKATGSKLAEDHAHTLQNIAKHVQQHLQKLPKNYLSKPILSGSTLSKAQMDLLSEVNDALCVDYQQRKELLLKRLDLSLESFKWSSKGQTNQGAINGIINKERKLLESISDTKIDLYNVLVARPAIAIIIKASVSSGEAIKDTKSSLKSLRIGNVPDRGGRQDRHLEMPGFKPREEKQQKPQREKRDRVQGGALGGDTNKSKSHRGGKRGSFGGNKRPKT